jgi:trehalose 2-sulfotransferase
MTVPERSYLVCATPRSGSTLVCQALKETGIAGRPEEYFEGLLQSGRPRRPEQYFIGVDDESIVEHLRALGRSDEPPPRSPLWSRAAYDRYLDWVLEAGTTDNGVFGAKLMWGYFGDFVSLLRNIPHYRDAPLAELLPRVFPNLSFIRVVRANKVRQAVSLWKAVQTASWRQEEGSSREADGAGDGPYRAYLESRSPQLRFHYRAINHLLDVILSEEASWDAFFEHSRIKPELVLYENFYADYEVATRNIVERLGLELPPGWQAKPRMKRQSTGLNDDWARRYSELRLGTRFDLAPAVQDPATADVG